MPEDKQTARYYRLTDEIYREYKKLLKEKLDVKYPSSRVKQLVIDDIIELRTKPNFK